MNKKEFVQRFVIQYGILHTGIAYHGVINEAEWFAHVLEKEGYFDEEPQHVGGPR